MSDTDTQGALTSGEASDLHGLENEMADPNGKVFDGHWRDHYNHNTAKQERARDLIAKRDGIFKTPQDAQEYEQAMNGPSAFDGFSAR